MIGGAAIVVGACGVALISEGDGSRRGVASRAEIPATPKGAASVVASRAAE